MHNDIKNNEHDAFSESIRQKLEGYKMPVEPAVWDAIEVGLIAGKPKKRYPFVWWITSGLAAAVALLLFVNLPDNQNESTNIATTINNNTIQEVKPTESIEQKNDIIASTTESKFIKTKQNSSLQNSSSLQNGTEKNSTKQTLSETSEIQTKVAQNEVVALNKAEEQSDIPTETIVDVAHNVIASAKETPIDSMVATPNANSNEKLQLKNEDWTDPLKEKNKGGWELVAMVGSAGKTNSTSQATPVFDYSPRMGIVSAEKASTYIFTPEDFSDKTYLAPVSVGFAIARTISPELSIESGISYSYLLTMFKSNSIDSKLNLHYVGLPVRVVYDFLKNNKWSFYTAAGGMIEKGVWSVYVQNQNYPNSIITTTVTDKINGFQYSLNASVGSNYRIFKNASIYFEPKISYYFDTNQPISIRTVTNVIVGFEGGLRYKF